MRLLENIFNYHYITEFVKVAKDPLHVIIATCHGDVGLGEINNVKINYIILVLSHIPITGIVN
jgi:hypothetical protein